MLTRIRFKKLFYGHPGNQNLSHAIPGLAHYGLKPDKNQRLHCPWHDDKTPSLQLYPKTNSWTCFGSNCSAGSGDAIEFCARMEKDKHKGILVAKSLVNRTDNSEPSQLSKIAMPETGRQAVLTKLFGYFKNAVSSSKPARDYLERRNLNPTPNWRKSVTCV